MTYYKIKKYEVEVETLEMVKEAIHGQADNISEHKDLPFDYISSGEITHSGDV